ncbi:MAG: hypothetical protein KC476_11060 [Cyanobacteria bacterium HKST-UBA06]|nr:hypothetical protein [Cyanobacteria bacterium HKST-UBA06]
MTLRCIGSQFRHAAAVCLAAMLLMACGGNGDAPAAAAPANPQIYHLDCYQRDIPRDKCTLYVHVEANGGLAALSVKTHTESGIHFVLQDEAESHDGQSPSLSIAPGGSREIPFDIVPADPGRLLSGRYVVDVCPQYTAGGGRPGCLPPLSLYVWIDGQNRLTVTDDGDANFLSHFPAAFVQGEHTLAYTLALNNNTRPVGGHLYLRIESLQDDYRPTITLSAANGILFEPNRNLTVTGNTVTLTPPDSINEGEMRVAVIPFHYQDGAIGGDRMLVARIIEANAAGSPDGGAWCERVPVGINISTPSAAGAITLGRIENAPMRINLTDPICGDPALGQGGIPPAATATPTTEPVPQSSGPPATATQTNAAASIEPTPASANPGDDSALGKTTGTEANPAPAGPAAASEPPNYVWVMVVGLSGSMQQVYDAYVRDRFNLSFDDFRREVYLQNQATFQGQPDLAFHPQTAYYFPQAP